MFPSTINATINPFPYLSSFSSYNPSPFFLNNHEATTSTDVFFQPTFSLLPNNPLTSSLVSTETLSSINAKQDINCYNIDQIDGESCYKQSQQLQQQQPSSCVFVSAKKPLKKDRHSKIHTSQGLRDRRVRLSIQIARKFFDLQDMLGFDKASKTLEWLLSKSKRAIKRVAHKRSSPSSSASSSSTCEALSPENGEIAMEEGIVSTGKNEKKAKKLEKYTTNLAAKELRVKARARARERTRIKMLNQYLLSNDELVDELPDAKENNIIEESIAIERKLKPSSVMGYQQNLLMLRDLTCNNSNYNNLNLPNFTSNWEINNAIARSSFCAITNMNRSAGLHLYGKLREAENGSQCLH
ncbi:hypothetical protein JCGZ_12960 [Jatropha curcas]|uniref:TCP domain-containing protein n=1 Tax=Jatropha curcas TaxID=180498 RepID=A0A067KM92_JATCU|nr:transcription factor CYCLOIDEA [Jatropha curcas]KDP32929.1 hypothetical protein JCGZ_12960 [Jatropha curcas]